jgi:hypothetical protein
MEIYRLYTRDSNAGVVADIAKKNLPWYLLIPMWYSDGSGILKQGSIIEFHAYDNDDIMKFIVFYDICVDRTDAKFDQCHWKVGKNFLIE